MASSIRVVRHLDRGRAGKSSPAAAAGILWAVSVRRLANCHCIELPAAQLWPAALGGVAIAGAAKARGTNTHGRWPWAAALAAPPAVALLAANRDRLPDGGPGAVWVSLPLLLCHQTEEWVLPDGFLPWFNRAVCGSDQDEFPITRRLGFVINVVGGWGLTVAAAVGGRRTAWLGNLVLTSTAGNGALHVARGLIERRYVPGLATGLLMGPLGALGAAALLRDPEARDHGSVAGLIAGSGASVALLVAMRRRARRAIAQTGA